MKDFKFVILGAGSIAHKFARAVAAVDGAYVSAVGSKSMERAESFAKEENIAKAYDSYEKMLIEEKPDAAYIATTVNFHYDQILLCIKHKIPVLCEKAMFMDSREAEDAYAKAKEAGVFLMEAMWSKFLPHMRKAQEWIRNGKIGELISIDANLGYLPDASPEGRFFNKALGGGTARDLLVYCYDLTLMLADEYPEETQAMHLYGETGVDVANLINLKFSSFVACLRSYFTAYGQSDIFKVYGTQGMIEIPSPHMGSDAILYRRDGTEEHFSQKVPNGFVFEVQEVMDCVRAGKLESEVVPWKLTMYASKIYDGIK